MEILTLALLKAVATTCLKVYLSSLMGGGGAIAYRSSELGYKVPKWYMNPGRAHAFYAYGTSLRGDEFESIDDARQRALEQMVNHIRLSNQKIVQEEVRYDETSIKQKRLIELFIRADGLEDFIRMNATVDKKQLVKVDGPPEDIRAFVQLSLAAKTYIEYQERTVKDLERNLLRQKSDDIIAEMEAEETAAHPFDPVMPNVEIQSPTDGGTTVSPGRPSQLPTKPVGGAEGAFDELENETP